MAYTVKLEKLGYKDGGPKIIAIFHEDVLGTASTMEISIDPDTTDDSLLGIVKTRLAFLTGRDAAFNALLTGAVDTSQFK